MVNVRYFYFFQLFSPFKRYHSIDYYLISLNTSQNLCHYQKDLSNHIIFYVYHISSLIYNHHLFPMHSSCIFLQIMQYLFRCNITLFKPLNYNILSPKYIIRLVFSKKQLLSTKKLSIVPTTAKYPLPLRLACFANTISCSL